MIISNNNFIDIFKEWADAKAPLINDFGYGPLSDWGNSRQLKYPCMWVTHQPTSSIVVQNKNLTPTHNFTIIFVDQINLQDNTQKQNGNDSDNRIHIMSDTQQLAFDFINDTILTFNKFKILAEPNITLSPIEDETTDKVNGWALDISFRTPYLNCTLPSITPNPTCQPAVVKNSNNTFSLTIPSGVTDTLPDSIITINNDSINLPATNDITINVKNNSGNDVGDLTINNTIIIDDTILTVNNTIIQSIDAEDSFEFNVKLDGVDSGSWNESTNTWEVESIPCADAIVTLDSESFLSLDAGSTTNITIKDEDGNSINPIGNDDTTIIIPNANEWIRPIDWLPIPSIINGEQVFYGLFAVYNVADSNYVAFSFQGNYIVDWGDGIVENFTSNVTATHQYSWASVGSVTSEGFRQALIKVTPQSGQNITVIDLQRFHPSIGTGRSQPFIDMVINAPNVSGTNLILYNNTIAINRNVQRIWIKEIGLLTSTVGMFQLCTSLMSVPIFNTSSVTDMSNMFNSCFLLKKVPLFNTSSVTNMLGMFNSCISLVNVPLFNTTNVTNMSNMFVVCRSLMNVPLFDTSSVTNITGMFQNCQSLQSIPNFNFSNVTTFTDAFNSNLNLRNVPTLTINSAINITRMFSGCLSVTVLNLNVSSVTTTLNAFLNNIAVQKLTLNGLTRGFSVQGCQMSATALNDLFTSLGTAIGSQTITVTGNPGAPTCNTSIATSKGFTVVI